VFCFDCFREQRIVRSQLHLNCCAAKGELALEPGKKGRLLLVEVETLMDKGVDVVFGRLPVVENAVSNEYADKRGHKGNDECSERGPHRPRSSSAEGARCETQPSEVTVDAVVGAARATALKAPIASAPTNEIASKRQAPGRAALFFAIRARIDDSIVSNPGCVAWRAIRLMASSTGVFISGISASYLGYARGACIP
jgi:hypothetical protein